MKPNEKVTGKGDAEDEEDTDSSDDQKDDYFNDKAIDSTNNKSDSISRQKFFPKIVFFGTGSSFPGTTRSATAILLHTS